MKSKRGYFGIGIYQPIKGVNIGTLWRSAYNFSADFIFTVGRSYEKQSSDTVKAYKHIPLYTYPTFESLRINLPDGCKLVGVELHPGASELPKFKHPDRCIYLLGAEGDGLPDNILAKCHEVVKIPSTVYCLNVSVAGSIVMYDRVSKAND